MATGKSSSPSDIAYHKRAAALGLRNKARKVAKHKQAHPNDKTVIGHNPFPQRQRSQFKEI